jgi:hypothetical protein
METNNNRPNIIAVRIGHGAKVHYSTESASVTFCGIYRGIHPTDQTQVSCERCKANILTEIWVEK